MRETATMDAGRELDALVAKLMDDEGEEYAFASNDGGQSGCAFTNRRDGPWYTVQSLEDWLAQKHGRNQMLDYKIIRKVRYRRYSTDIAAAWTVVEKVGFLWHGFKFLVCCYQEHDMRLVWEAGWYEWGNEGPEGRATAVADTPAIAICRAALAALTPPPDGGGA